MCICGDLYRPYAFSMGFQSWLKPNFPNWQDECFCLNGNAEFGYVKIILSDRLFYSPLLETHTALWGLMNIPFSG